MNIRSTAAVTITALVSMAGFTQAVSAVSDIVIGTSSVAHLEEDIAAAHIRLTAAELSALG